jgi:hypothetical protein
MCSIVRTGSSERLANLQYCLDYSSSSLLTQCALLCFMILLQRTRAREKAVSMSERQEEMDKAAEKRWSQLQVLALQLPLQVVRHTNVYQLCDSLVRLS